MNQNNNIQIINYLLDNSYIISIYLIIPSIYILNLINNFINLHSYSIILVNLIFIINLNDIMLSILNKIISH